MRELLTTLGELIGAALIAAGVWSFSAPLGLIVAGALIAVFSYLAAE